jgi:hypothetical protein
VDIHERVLLREQSVKIKLGPFPIASAYAFVIKI